MGSVTANEAVTSRMESLAAHAFLLGGFTAFCQVGRLHRLVLAWRVFGRDRVDGEIRRIRSVLAGRTWEPGCSTGSAASGSFPACG